MTKKHYAWVVEGILNRLPKQFFVKCSVVDWNTFVPSETSTTEKAATNAMKYKYCVWQWLVGKHSQVPWINGQKKPLYLYGAFLMNPLAKATKTTLNGKENLAWFIGGTLGGLRKAGDWSATVRYEYVEALSVPEIDVSGIGRGNLLKFWFAQAIAANYDPKEANGFTNYKGFSALYMYGITDSLSFRAYGAYSKPANDKLGSDFTFRKFDLGIISAGFKSNFNKIFKNRLALIISESFFFIFYNKTKRFLLFFEFLLVNPIGPGPIDETERTPPADLSAQGLEASAANKSAEAQRIAGAEAKPKESKTDSVERWSILRSAVNALMSLADKLGIASSNSSSSTSRSADVDSTTATAPTPPPPTFDDYKTQAQTAYDTIFTSTSLADIQAALVSLQDAVTNIKDTAATDEETAIAAEWETKNADAVKVGAQITELAKYASDNQAILDSLGKLTSFDLLQAALLQSVANNNKAAELLKEMQDNPVVPGKTPAIAQSLVDQTDATATQIEKDGNAIRDAYFAGQNASGAVENAKSNNSISNIDSAKAAIATAKTQIAEAQKKFPDSPILQEAEQMVIQAEKDLKNIKPADGSDVPNPGTTVGGSKQQGSSIGSIRVSMLLDDAENETASILMSGFRQMIHMFNTENPDSQAAQQELAAQARAAKAAGDDSAAAALADAQKALEAALGKAGQQQGILNALGQIASAAVVSAGVLPLQQVL
uniref:76 kDa protein n=1 Tax=Chlamydia pneumoniae TaxID=83558 RepID=Q46166_CHLPN|nr:76 kDa protein [Chlamydia pneumoniae]